MPYQQEQTLADKRIVITRDPAQASSLQQKLESAGAEVLHLPLITVSREVNEDKLQDVWETLARYEWLVFTSPNGVCHFMQLFLEQFDDIRAIGPARIACVGKTTAKAFEPYYLAVDLTPPEAYAESLATALVNTDSLDNAMVLVVTGNQNRDVLPSMLEQEGRAIVDTLQVYRTDYTDLSQEPEAARFRQEGADYILFTSSSTVESFINQAKHLQLGAQARKPQTCSIGPITSQKMKDKSMPVHLQAEEASLDGLIAALTG